MGKQTSSMDTMSFKGHFNRLNMDMCVLTSSKKYLVLCISTSNLNFAPD